MDAKRRERIDSQVMTAMRRGETSRKRISQTTGIDALDVLDLARMVGHKDPRSLMIYYNATATEIANRLD